MAGGSIIDDALSHLSNLPGNFQAQSLQSLFGNKVPTGAIEEVASQPLGGGPQKLTEGLIGKETIKSIFEWNIIGSLISSAIGPYLEEVARIVNYITPIVPMSPAILADGVVRGFVDPNKAAHDAALSGVNGEDFTTLTQLAGDAPSPTGLAEALRRGIIPFDSGNPDKIGFVQGIEQGRLANKWIPMIQGLAYALPSPTDAIEMGVKATVDHAQAIQFYKAWGGDPAFYDDLLATAGNSPTPLEAAAMYFRGIIQKDGLGKDMKTYQQAVAESRYKTKWTDAYYELAQTLPTVQQISTLLKSGAINHTEGRAMLKEHGMGDQAIGYFLADASSSKTGASKQLAESTVLSLYVDHLASRDSVLTMLEALKYTKDEANFILEVQDLKQVEAALKSAISRIQSLYIGHKINKTAAINALNTLGVPAKEVDGLIQTWVLEQRNNVKTLTQAEVTDAFHLGFISQDEAILALEQIGYQPHDAWILLSLKEKVKLPGEPPLNSISNVAL